jgi:hypothetical protein
MVGHITAQTDTLVKTLLAITLVLEGADSRRHIEIAYAADDTLAEALEACGEMIRKGTLALRMERKAAEDGYAVKEWDINDRKATLAVRKAR